MTEHLPTCYMCAAEETSREHAPPQCLFPAASDIGRDLRRNLITVPSCDEHNSKKSADDEFLRAVILCTAVDSNDIARHQFLGKFLRGVQRNSQTYSGFFKEKCSTSSDKNRVLQLERNRFDKCIDHLARALFFHTSLLQNPGSAEDFFVPASGSKEGRAAISGMMRLPSQTS